MKGEAGLLGGKCCSSAGQLCPVPLPQLWARPVSSAAPRHDAAATHCVLPRVLSSQPSVVWQACYSSDASPAGPDRRLNTQHARQGVMKCSRAGAQDLEEQRAEPTQWQRAATEWA